MKQFANYLKQAGEKLGYQLDESEFIRNGNKLEYGKSGMKLEDGKYVLYHNCEAVGTFNEFIPCLNGLKQLTRE